jgi:biotin carboxyl carrier protein
MISGKVGAFEITWKTIPRGPQGTAQVEVREGKGAPRILEVRWRRDAEGLSVELPHGEFGYEILSEIGDDGGRTQRLARRGSERAWEGVAFLRAGEEQTAAAGAGAKKGVRVRAQMPGKILRVHVKPGDAVEKGQSLIVMEAMKMENEIRAAQAGTIDQVKVVEGQAVETGADLCTIKTV